jgi:hypothetical protein
MEQEVMCDYGCGGIAHHYFGKAKKHCCSDHYRKCPHQAALAGAKRRGHKHSEETKRIIGENFKRYFRENGHPGLGKTMSDERKKHQSDMMKGKPNWAKGLTADTDPRLMKALEYRLANIELYTHKGEANGMFGKTHSDEVKQQLRDKNIQDGRWIGEDNPWYGVDRSGEKSPRYLPDEIRREWKTYKNHARYWTEKEYISFMDVINPQRLSRGIREYHIDHIVPLWYGFIHGIDPKLLSKKENLRMLWYKDNQARRKDTLDEIGESTLQILNSTQI